MVKDVHNSEGKMKKKMAGMGLCLVLASSMCVADNPFSEDAEVKLEAAADTVSSTADVAAEEATAVTSATETATDTETKTANYTVSAGDFIDNFSDDGDGSHLVSSAIENVSGTIKSIKSNFTNNYSIWWINDRKGGG